MDPNMYKVLFTVCLLMYFNKSATNCTNAV